MGLELVLPPAPWRIAVIGAQWGDEAKGKVVDVLAEHADVIVRCTGGDNAAHTVCFGGHKQVLHLLPSGILRDAEGKINIIGRGVAVNPATLFSEIAAVTGDGYAVDHLKVSHMAKVVMPQHILLDRLRFVGAGKVGSTGRGIGPCYVDHVDRIGVTVGDLLNPKQFADKLTGNLEPKMRLLKGYNKSELDRIYCSEAMERGLYRHSNGCLDGARIFTEYVRYGKLLRPYVADTDEMVANDHHQNILLEGAQGALLDVEHGTYPFVTSTSCGITGVCEGAGIDPRDITMMLGVAKAPYMTRVGGGDFPTELGGGESRKWCDQPGQNRQNEWAQYPHATINSAEAMAQGVAIRRIGDEYGGTSGRPRRIGWFDLPLLQRVLQSNRGMKLVLTKLDVMDQCNQIKICSQYRYIGPDYHLAGQVITKDHIFLVAPMDAFVLAHCVPLYETFCGWCCQTSDIRDFTKLPANLMTIVRFIATEVEASVVAISVGPDRDQIIVIR